MCFKQYISLVRAISLIAIISICNACAVQSQRVNQFDKFAQAGIAYAEAVPAVLDESFVVTVTSDSFSLIAARPSLDQAARLPAAAPHRHRPTTKGSATRK